MARKQPVDAKRWDRRATIATAIARIIEAVARVAAAIAKLL
jgi:hypothetical protein